MESIRQAQKVIAPGGKTPGYNPKFKSRYGRLDQGVPETMTEQGMLTLIEKDFTDGKLSENEYLRKKILAKSKIASLIWIATTNNMGRNPYPRMSGRPLRNRSQ